MNTGGRNTFLDESDGSEVDGDDTQNFDLKINKKFARSYEDRKRKHELAQAREKDLQISDSDESESETEDEDADALTTNLDVQIMKTINKIRSKDPSIYDPKASFFEAQGEEGSDALSLDSDEETSKSKKMTYKDVVREQILGAETAEDVIEDSDNEEVSIPGHQDLAYDQEQQSLRQAFLQESKTTKQKGGEGQENEDDDLLRIRTKAQALDDGEIESELRKELEKLGDDSNEGDTFLKDFLMNKKWKEKEFAFGNDSDEESRDVNEMTGANAVEVGKPRPLATLNDSEDEEEFDKAERFESQYNFRFEEEQGASIQTFAREVKGTFRRKDESRKKARELKKQRKAEERKRKEEELKRLKNLKREEIKSKLSKISEHGGGVALDESALEEDFDPDKFDEQMAKAFGDSYYDGEDENWKPEDEWTGENDEYWPEYMEGIEQNGEYQEEAYEGVYDEEDAQNQEDVPEELELSEKDKNNIKKQLFDELYKLDYEDIIEDIPCRFKYRQVAKEDFGIDTDEILLADDKELNSLVSLKKLAPYREKKLSINAKKRANFRRELRSRLKEEEERNKTAPIKDDLNDKDGQNPGNDDDTSAVSTSGKPVKKKRKKKGKKKKKGQDPEETCSPQGEYRIQDIPVEVKNDLKRKEVQCTNKKKKRSKKKKTAKLEATAIQLSKSRLASYGL